MRLDRVLAAVDVLELRGDPSGVEVAAITHDSRRVQPGALYCALPGSVVDGHDFVAAAVTSGAVAVLGERMVPVDVVQARVAPGEARPALARAAAAFHGWPSRDLAVAGVTGTNGKTTVTHFLAGVLEAHGWPTGVIGTLSGARTTPEASDLQALLANMRDRGQRAVAMEVSSHALVQHRVDEVHFAVAVFTNLSPEHLDFHGTMEDYFAAKAILFDPQRAERAVINVDDSYGARLLKEAHIPAVGFSLAEVEGYEVTASGSRFRWDGVDLIVRLGGQHNAANALAAATAARSLGVPAATIAAGIAAVERVPGRFEMIDEGQPFTVIVDYAHTPDGLTRALNAARQAAAGRRVAVVFGCGGDRDRAKRPLMGRVAAELADLAVVTSDNPRTEDPLAIIDAIRAGADPADRLVVEPDRAVAIEMAVNWAQPGDVVLLAGKGHETGQVIGTQTRPFDDRDAARAALASLPSPGGHR